MPQATLGVRGAGILFLLAGAAAGQATAPLTRAAAVKQLSAEQARATVPVTLRGTVTQVIPEWGAFSLQDATDGIYISSSEPLPEGLRIGEVVEVTGRAVPGNFAPGVRATAVRILGPSAMPAPRRVEWEALATGACDNQYVQIEGVARSVGTVGPPEWEWRAQALRLDLGGRFVWVYLRDRQALPDQPLVDGTVRARGVCIVLSNSGRQSQGTVLSVSRGEDIELVHAGARDPFDAPAQEIAKLFSFHAGTVSFHRVKVAGIAVLQGPGGVYLQQGHSGILVRAAADANIRPGDRVEAVGFPTTANFATVLEDGALRVTAHNAEPAPLNLQAAKVLARVSNAPAAPSGVLIRVQGQVLDRSRSAQDETLTVADGGTTFGARLRAHGENGLDVQPGSRVAITGVCTVQTDERGLPRSFELLLRSPADVAVLQRAPWLSRTAALEVAAAMLALLGVVVIWVAMLRRRVEKQTATIRSQFERAAALEQRYTELVENASDMVFVRDLDGVLLQVNRGTEEMTGYSRDELLRMNLLDLLAPEERDRARAALAPGNAGEAVQESSEWRFRAKDGRELVIETKQRFLMENGRPVQAECIGRDVTDRQRAQMAVVTEKNRLEEQLQHAQKLESVGRLAGGVAHDFNNLLTVIAGYAQMAQESLPANDSLRGPIGEIMHAAERAEGLTRQLLLFSRRQRAAPQTLSLDGLVGQVERMLRRLIGEDIQLELRLDAPTGWIRVDPGHIEQVIMNLVVNARDAMPKGGRLTISTACLRANREYASRHLGVEEGDWVTLEISDTGTGMAPEVQSRIFEPFFTTKEQGKGTGLGLSMVYGIVKQSGGAIFVESEAGRGTAFTVMFPAVQPEAKTGAGEMPAQAAAASGETILLAEDEAGVRKYIRSVLADNGYQVLEAADGREAMEKAAQFTGPIHLLLTDVVMPEMGGVALAERFTELRPGTPVLHMSGYADGLVQPVDPERLLQKPFQPAALLARVAAALDAKGLGRSS